MDAVVAALITAIVGAFGGYVVGNWRLKYEHLHERRAGVIARLCELLAAVQRGVVGFTSPLQPGDVEPPQASSRGTAGFL